MNQDETNSSGSWLGHRRKVVAHEVPKPAKESQATSGPVHVEVEAAGSRVKRPVEIVLDPTLLSERTRKHRHQTIYHLSQIAITGTFAAAAMAIVCPLAGKTRLGYASVGAAVMLAGLSYRLVRLTRLSRRLRGYAAAGIVLAVFAGAVNIGAMMMMGESERSAPAHGPASLPAGGAAPSPLSPGHVNKS